MIDLSSRTARRRLKPRSSAYTQTLAEGRALGYRKRTAGAPGRWMLRTAALDRAGYDFEMLGAADDIADADGREVLDYRQALAAAAGRRSADPTQILVADALASWARAKAATASSPRQVAVLEATARRIGDAFPRRTLKTISAADIASWMTGFISNGGDPRARRSTANRELSALKAALTRSANMHGFEGRRGWDAAKKFARSDSFGRRMLILTPEQEEAWIGAAPPDAADLLRALQITGARYGELRNADVGDLAGDRLRLHGKTGERVITLSPEKAAWFAGVAAGRPAHEPLLLRRGLERWADAGHSNVLRAAARDAGLPPAATSYALRHGFISRALARGVPTVAVAMHCGTSAAVIEKSYAKFTADVMGCWFS